MNARRAFSMQDLLQVDTVSTHLHIQYIFELDYFWLFMVGLIKQAQKSGKKINFIPYYWCCQDFSAQKRLAIQIKGLRGKDVCNFVSNE